MQDSKNQYVQNCRVHTFHCSVELTGYISYCVSTILWILFLMHKASLKNPNRSQKSRSIGHQKSWVQSEFVKFCLQKCSQNRPQSAGCILSCVTLKDLDFLPKALPGQNNTCLLTKVYKILFNTRAVVPTKSINFICYYNFINNNDIQLPSLNKVH